MHKIISSPLDLCGNFLQFLLSAVWLIYIISIIIIISSSSIWIVHGVHNRQKRQTNKNKNTTKHTLSSQKYHKNTP